MKQINYKKLILPNIPYVFIALLITKVSEAARLAPGADLSGKLLNIMTGMSTAFQSILPSFHPIDLCVGIAAAVVIRLVVYFKGKNAKKFRKNLEYGSARWGNADDIRPYRYTSDYDKKNAFDIERFMSHRLKLKPDDAFEVYRVDLSGEPVA